MPAYLAGRAPGERRSLRPDGFDRCERYVRLADDPHLWATMLFDESAGWGYAGSYPSFTRVALVALDAMPGTAANDLANPDPLPIQPSRSASRPSQWTHGVI